MPVFALFNFDDVDNYALDSALENGAQLGVYLNGASASGGQAVLDGVNDLVKIYPDPSFQMDRGTLDISFTLGDNPLTGTQTVLSRDSVGTTDGGYRIEILANGSVVISHETPTGTETFGTPAGFANPGDSINLSYSWDQGGTGGSLNIDNVTTGGSFNDDVPNTLTMDMGPDISQPWMVGAGQANSDPNTFNNVNQHFEGSVSVFQLSDTVDNGGNGNPDANPDTATTTEDTPVTIPVLANDTDPQGQPLTVTTATAPNGTVTINPDGTLTYTPNADYNGPDTITYTVTDPDGNTDTTTVSVTVTPVNDAPEANPDTSSTALNTPVTFAVLGNDTDVDGDTLTIQGTPTSPNGTVAVNADGTLTFTPNPGFTGDAVVNYTIVDPEGLTDTTTWTITVGTGTGNPDANPDTATTPEDTPVTIPVLANDTDPQGQPLTVTTATAPNGTVTINPDGTLTYTPNADYNGPDTITYTVTDPDGNTDTTTVSVTVTPVNDAPEANPDVSTTPFDTPVTFAVLGNDTDVDGDTLTITGTPTSPDGTVAVNADGTLTFTPNPGFTGDAVVSYSIVDEEGLTDSTTWTITVADQGANNPPVAEDDVADTVVNTPVTIAILANDSDPDGDPLLILGTPTSADGTVVVNPDGTITFTPNPDFVGEATINYMLTDGNGGTDTAVVTVTVIDPGTRDGIVRGTPGDDLINGAYTGDNDGDVVDGNDAILPGDAPNDDRILAGAGNDTVNAGLGNDSVEGGTGNDVLNGEAGNDILFGQDGDDTLNGGAGDDTIYGGRGNDSVLGGEGNDYIDTRGGTNPLPDQDYPGLYGADADPNDDRDTVRGGAGNDTIFTGDDRDDIEGGFGDDYIDAGFDDDRIDGNQGNDTIIGAEGNDTIDGGDGDDLIYGGYGPGIPDSVNLPDSIDLRPNNGRDSINGGQGNDTIFGQDDDDTIDGGQGDDLIYGGVDEDLIFGNVGNDTLFGDDGNDTISGGQGNDVLTGGLGADLLSGDADRDTFVVGSQLAGNGDTVYGGSSGDDWDTLNLTGAGPYRLTGVVTDSDGNGIDGTVEFLDADGNVTGSLVFTNIEEIVPCFTPGTLVATPKGEVPVEHLKAGDRVITRDNGIQEIRWAGQKTLGWKDLAANPHLKPVLIRQGSLGNGLPERDMMVSPNHRMLVANDRTALYFDEHEVLVSAKHLVAGQGIHSIDSIGTTYIHFMFDRHEVVLGNGAWTESFQPGDLTLKGMGNSQRTEIFELFPELKTDAGLNDYQAARRTLKKHEARLLAK